MHLPPVWRPFSVVFAVGMACVPGLAQTLPLAMTRDLVDGLDLHAYDSARQRLVAMRSAPALTFEHDGVRWRERTLVGQPGNGRFLADVAEMVYDQARREVVMFVGDLFSATRQTWTYDGVAWVQRQPTVMPTAGWGFSMAYDERRSRCVLFGGIDTAPGSYGVLDTDVWEWDGSQWSVVPTPLHPPGRAQGALAYDRARGVTVLFGGGWMANLNDTWEWDGVTWRAIATASAPAPRTLAMLGFDPSGGHMVLGGGRHQNGVWLGDTWTFQGGSWSQVTTIVRPVPENPAGNMVTTPAGLLVPESQTGGLLRFSGTDWVQYMASTGVLPFADVGDVAADPGLTSLLCVGRDAGGRATYLFQGDHWAAVRPAVAPPVLGSYAIAADTQRGRVVLFGGYTGAGYSQDTWEWDGLVWLLRQPTNIPSARENAAMAYDESRGLTVLYGGRIAAGSFIAETWAWDGSDWTQSGAIVPTTGIYSASMAYDPTRSRVVMNTVASRAVMDLQEFWSFDGIAWHLEPWPQQPVGKLGFDPGQLELVSVAPVAGGSTVTRVRDGQLLAVIDRGISWMAKHPLWNRAFYGGQFRSVTELVGGPQFTVSSAVAGCPGSSGVPRLVASTAPRLATANFELHSSGFPASSPVFVMLALTSGNLPVGACTLWPAPATAALVFVPATPGGFAALPLPLPTDPALAGTVLHAQSLGLDPVAASGVGFSASNGLRFTLGN